MKILVAWYVTAVFVLGALPAQNAWALDQAHLAQELRDSANKVIELQFQKVSGAAREISLKKLRLSEISEFSNLITLGGLARRLEADLIAQQKKLNEMIQNESRYLGPERDAIVERQTALERECLQARAFLYQELLQSLDLVALRKAGSEETVFGIEITRRILEYLDSLREGFRVLASEPNAKPFLSGLNEKAFEDKRVAFRDRFIDETFSLQIDLPLRIKELKATSLMPDHTSEQAEKRHEALKSVQAWRNTARRARDYYGKRSNLQDDHDPVVRLSRSQLKEKEFVTQFAVRYAQEQYQKRFDDPALTVDEKAMQLERAIQLLGKDAAPVILNALKIRPFSKTIFAKALAAVETELSGPYPFENHFPQRDAIASALADLIDEKEIDEATLLRLITASFQLTGLENAPLLAHASDESLNCERRLLIINELWRRKGKPSDSSLLKIGWKCALETREHADEKNSPRALRAAYEYFGKFQAEKEYLILVTENLHPQASLFRQKLALYLAARWSISLPDSSKPVFAEELKKARDHFSAAKDFKETREWIDFLIEALPKLDEWQRQLAATPYVIGYQYQWVFVPSYYVGNAVYGTYEWKQVPVVNSNYTAFAKAIENLQKQLRDVALP